MFPGVLAIALMASLPILRAFLVFLDSILAASTGLVGWLEMKNMHVWIYSQCINAFISAGYMHKRINCFTGKHLDDFLPTKKSPLDGGLRLTEGG